MQASLILQISAWRRISTVKKETLKNETLAQVFSCEFCEILWTPFLQNTSARLLLWNYFQRYVTVTCRSMKKAIFKHSQNPQENTIVGGSCLVKLLARKPATLLKRDFATSVLLWIANFFRIPFLWNTYWWLLLDMQKFTHVQIIVEILRRKWSNNEKPLKINWRLMLQNYVNYKMSNRLIKSHTWELCFFTSINFEICEAFVFVIISSIKKWRIKS